MSRASWTTAVAVALAAAGAVTFAALSWDGATTTVVRQVTVTDAQSVSNARTLSVAEIYRRSHRAVVQITARSSSGPLGATQAAQGTGFVYDANGDIVTNEHVIDGAGSITVGFWNGRTYTARLIGSDASTDLALLRVDAPASMLHPLALGDSSSLQVGDSVVAIGSPFGLSESVTHGIVSALERHITSPNGATIGNAIQTDAAINHGNSGGPLLNDEGQVVGVTAQIESDSGGNDGVGFAIPSSLVRTTVARLLAGSA